MATEVVEAQPLFIYTKVLYLEQMADIILSKESKA